jgi:hypothetical protein
VEYRLAKITTRKYNAWRILLRLKRRQSRKTGNPAK